MENTQQQSSSFFADLSDSNKILHRLDVIRENLNRKELIVSEYEAACLRIRSAERYLQSDEIGPARQEIRMLVNQLNSASHSVWCMDAGPVEAFASS